MFLQVDDDTIPTILEYANVNVTYMRGLQNTNFNFLIGNLCTKPIHRCQLMSMPLYHLLSLPLVRPVLEFVYGYREGDKDLYVFIIDDKGRM